MCGRICLTLQPNEIQCACKYKVTTKDKDNNDDEDNVIELTPEWKSEKNLNKKYQPSYNISPTSVTPVLISTKHVNNNKKQDDVKQTRVIVPMLWAMIPFWHKGDYRKHGLTTNNCRLEHMLESKLYSKPFRKGQRCVILCEGFYEWQTTKSAKPSEREVYYIYMPQSDDIKIHDKSTWKSHEDLKLLKIAGLFDVWQDENGDKIYSYSIITFESNDTLSWLHHRMPAILETEEQISDWLDFDRVSDEIALACLKQPPMVLSWYRISNYVNNSRNQSEICNKPLKDVKENKKCGGAGIVPKSKMMQSWLIIRKRKEDTLKEKFAADSDDDDNDEDEIFLPKAKYSRLRGNDTQAENGE